MNVEKMIERLEAWNEQHLSVVCGNGHFACDYLCENEDCIVVRAATALSTLQAENENLRAELERVTAERDGAIKDLNEFLSMDELCPIQCEWCKWKDTFCDGKTPEWRGQKED